MRNGQLHCGDFEHEGHNLVKSNGAGLGESSLSFIPEELLELGKMLKHAGFSSYKISQGLESEAYRRAMPISWNYQDVYNKFAPSQGERILNATNFSQYLKSRHSDYGLSYELSLDSEGSLDIVFWILRDSLEEWAIDSDNHPVFYDTSHGTNKYALKFGAFTTINLNGQTIILACSLLTNETEESFSWVFNEFINGFHKPPRIIFTGGGWYGCFYSEYLLHYDTFTLYISSFKKSDNTYKTTI